MGVSGPDTMNILMITTFLSPQINTECLQELVAKMG